AMMGDKTLKAVVKPATQEAEAAEEVLQLSDASINGDHGETVLESVRLTLKRGEIVGVAGISGNGQRELAETLFGLRGLAAGTLKVKGRPMSGEGPSAFIEAGVTFVSEDP